MRNPFIWLSGADQGIIDECGKLAPVEHNKFFGYGTTVAIPAVLGCLSAGYAASTFTQTAWVYIPIAIIWFFIVLAIDRFLVSTLYKSKINDPFVFYLSLFMRMVMAVVLGVLISHPIVLYIFKEAINSKITQEHKDKYLVNVETIQKAEGSGEDIALRKEKELKLDCVRTLVSFEASGAKREAFDTKGRSCGFSTGKAGYVEKGQSGKYQKQIDELKADIEKISGRIKDESDRYKPVIKDSMDEYASGPSFDYMTRTEALEKLTAKSSHIWWAEKLIMLALILIDCLLIMLKATTPIGAYEIKKDQFLYEIEKTSEVERKAIDIHATTAGEELYKAKRKIKAVKEEMDAIMDLPVDFLRSEDNRMRRFDKHLKSVSANHGPDFTHTMRNLYTDTFVKAKNRLNEFLKSA